MPPNFPSADRKGVIFTNKIYRKVIHRKNFIRSIRIFEKKLVVLRPIWIKKVNWNVSPSLIFLGCTRLDLELPLENFETDSHSIDCYWYYQACLYDSEFYSPLMIIVDIIDWIMLPKKWTINVPTPITTTTATSHTQGFYTQDLQKRSNLSFYVIFNMVQVELVPVLLSNVINCWFSFYFL